MQIGGFNPIDYREVAREAQRQTFRSEAAAEQARTQHQSNQQTSVADVVRALLRRATDLHVSREDAVRILAEKFPPEIVNQEASKLTDPSSEGMTQSGSDGDKPGTTAGEAHRAGTVARQDPADQARAGADDGGTTGGDAVGQEARAKAARGEGTAASTAERRPPLAPPTPVAKAPQTGTPPPATETTASAEKTVPPEQAEQPLQTRDSSAGGLRQSPMARRLGTTTKTGTSSADGEVVAMEDPSVPPGPDGQPQIQGRSRAVSPHTTAKTVKTAGAEGGEVVVLCATDLRQVQDLDKHAAAIATHVGFRCLEKGGSTSRLSKRGDPSQGEGDQAVDAGSGQKDVPLSQVASRFRDSGTLRG